LSSEIQYQLADIQNRLKNLGANIKWVKPGNIHITLKFLGDVSENNISPICDALIDVVKDQKPFDLVLKDTGVFPHPGKPRVLWVGIGSGSESLRTLAKKIEDRLHNLGFSKEKRPYSPHLTIGRVRSPKNSKETVDKLLSISVRNDVFRINKIVLMKSDLHPTGAVYTALNSFNLEG
jgi:2'-5' RNA ligase